MIGETADRWPGMQTTLHEPLPVLDGLVAPSNELALIDATNGPGEIRSLSYAWLNMHSVALSVALRRAFHGGVHSLAGECVALIACQCAESIAACIAV